MLLVRAERRIVMLLIPPSLFFLFFIFPVIITMVVDCPMVHHSGHSGTTVQKQVACRQQGLFDITTETDVVEILVSDGRPIYCRILACGQTRGI